MHRLLIRIFMVAVVLVPCVAQAQITYQELVSFRAEPAGFRDPLVVGQDGLLYGTAERGGVYDGPILFRFDPADPPATFAVLHVFDTQEGRPSPLTLGSDGAFYGTMTAMTAGAPDAVFKVTPGGVFTKLASFNQSTGTSPVGGLVEAGDGNFYGITQQGTIFSMTPLGSLTSVMTFSGGPYNPAAGLTLGGDGALYGARSDSGLNGTIFRVTTGGAFSVVATLPASIGVPGPAPLVRDRSEGLTFYGISVHGSSNLSAVYKCTVSAGTCEPSALATVSGAYDYRPTSLTQAADGYLYGTTSGDEYGYNYGTAFKLASAIPSSPVTLVTFDSSNGAFPLARLVETPDGNLYGSTHQGGPSGLGTVFRLSSSGSFASLPAFLSPHGHGPHQVLRARDGNFYGLTGATGSANVAIFKMTADGVITTLVSFTGGSGGRYPMDLVEGADGNLYGVTQDGGSAHVGTMFKVTPTGRLTTLASFDGRLGYPQSLFAASDGKFYGTAYGAPVGNGAAFVADASGHVEMLANFGPPFVSYPQGRLLEGSDGTLYGRSSQGVFSLSRTGALTTIASLDWPMSLILGRDGCLYGTTYAGGTNDSGVIFRLDTNPSPVTVLASFPASPWSTGRYPFALVEGAPGVFYGYTAYGGDSNIGAVFRYSSTSGLERVVSFGAGTGANATTLIAGGEEEFYLAQTSGGSLGGGGLFRLSNLTPLASDLGSSAIAGLFASGGTPVAGTLIGRDFSQPPASVSFSIVSPPVHGTALMTDAATGQFTYTPVANYAGRDSFTYKLHNASGDSNVATAFIAVENIGPVISPIADRSIDEDTNTGRIALAISDVDNPAEALIVTATSSNTGLVPNGSLAIDGGFFTATPTANGFGQTTIIVTVSDGNLSSSCSFVLTVLPVNDPPTLTAISNQTIAEDETATVYFSADDVDAAPGQLALSAEFGNAALVAPNAYTIDAGSFPGGFNRRLVITPKANQSGVTTVTIRAKDGGAPALESTSTFTLTVTAVDDPPTISDIANRTMNENTTDGPIAFAIGDVDDPETGASPWTAFTSSSNATLLPPGSLVLGGGGGNRTLTITPAHNQYGTAVVMVMFQSKLGSAAADFFTLTVNAVDRAASIQSQPVDRAVRAGHDVSFTATADGQPAPTVQWQVSTNGGGTWANVDGATSATYAFTAAAADNGKRFRAVFTNAAGSATTNAAKLTVRTRTIGDFDGDGIADMTVYRGDGRWMILESSRGFTGAMFIDWGGAGYTPVAGDYDGDGLTDPAVYDVAHGRWLALESSTHFTTVISKTWGNPGEVPVPGDYDGDGRTDPAMYDPATGLWRVLTSSGGYTTTLTIVAGKGTPLPGFDFDNDGASDIVVVTRQSHMWKLLLSGTAFTTPGSLMWGGRGDTLVAGDYDGDGRDDLAVYDPVSGMWRVMKSSGGMLNRGWGGAGYDPVPGDYDGDGKFDLAVVQRSTGNWFVLLSSSGFTTTVSASGWGATADALVSTAVAMPPASASDVTRAADVDGDGSSDFTIYDSASGLWTSVSSAPGPLPAITTNWGGTGYTAVPGDFDGDGRTDRAVYRQSTGDWYVLLSSSNFTTSLYRNAGGPGYVPVPGDYDGDGLTDFAVYNTTTGLWYVLKSGANYTTTLSIGWGGTGYTAVPADFDGDGATDLALYVPATGAWHVLLSGAGFTTALNKYVGGAGYDAVPGDYDGDGKADFVVFNATSGLWYGLKSGSGYTTTFAQTWGTGGVAVKGDVDGDGRMDPVVYQPSSHTWYALLSGSNYTSSLTRTWTGAGGDVVVPR